MDKQGSLIKGIVTVKCKHIKEEKQEKAKYDFFVAGHIFHYPSGIGDMEDELFTLNETGKSLWALLDGKRTLANIVDEITNEYEAPKVEIEEDVLGLTDELLKRKMLSLK